MNKKMLLLMIFTGKNSKIALCVAIFVTVATVFLSFFVKTNLSLEFTGGTSLTIQSNPNITLKNEYKIKKISENITQITIPESINQNEKDTLINNLKINPDVKIMQVDKIGAKFGKSTLIGAIYSIFTAFLMIFFYIFIKFGKNMAIFATIGLFHNMIFVYFIVIIAKFELDLMVVSAFLTLVGYCINDTVVVFDRIRTCTLENPKKSQEDTINMALKLVLKRSFITSGVTSIGIAPLAFFIDGSIKNFAILTILGIIYGAFVSIFTAPIASNLGFKINIKIPKPQNNEKYDPMKFV